MLPFDILPPQPPEQALVSMVDSPYGFSVVDFGLADEDVENFDQIVLSNNLAYNVFGTVDDFASQVVPYLQKIGENDPCTVSQGCKLHSHYSYASIASC